MPRGRARGRGERTASNRAFQKNVSSRSQASTSAWPAPALRAAHNGGSFASTFRRLDSTSGEGAPATSQSSPRLLAIRALNGHQILQTTCQKAASGQVPLALAHNALGVVP